MRLEHHFFQATSFKHPSFPTPHILSSFFPTQKPTICFFAISFLISNTASVKSLKASKSADWKDDELPLVKQLVSCSDERLEKHLEYLEDTEGEVQVKDPKNVSEELTKRLRAFDAENKDMTIKLTKITALLPKKKSAAASTKNKAAKRTKTSTLTVVRRSARIAAMEMARRQSQAAFPGAEKKAKSIKA